MSEAEARAVAAALAGDEGAFRDLYRAHTPTMYRLALRMTAGSDSAAEDVVQEAWARAVRALSGFEHRSALRTWLHGIVTRCALERIRRERVHAGGSADTDGLPDPHPASDGRHLDLERAFEALPPGYRTIVVLHDIEGYTHERIGELLGVTAGTSKSQLSRARAWLRRALGRDYLTE